MKIQILFAVALSILAISACQTASTQKLEHPAQNGAESQIKQITVTEAKPLVETKDVQFIDVRTVGEYSGGHAPHAVSFPLDLLENDLAKLNKDKPVYVICQTGRRSQNGAEILQKAGFKSIYNINGGTAAWVEAGFPIEH
jgi:rhodanese-related sulfurtransferase